MSKHIVCMSCLLLKKTDLSFPGTSHTNVRKRPHILYWVRSLLQVLASGGDPNKAVMVFDRTQQFEDQLKNAKRSAVFNLLLHVPQTFLQRSLEHLEAAGSWDDSGASHPE